MMRINYPPNKRLTKGLGLLQGDVEPASPIKQRGALMKTILCHCKKNRWAAVLDLVRRDPTIAAVPMYMNNRITTTVMHQAITAQGDIDARAQVIREILRAVPVAAAIKNGFGSLPLHVIGQRNTKMDAITKEELMFELVAAYPAALLEAGGKGKRTPLHVLFTDYVSTNLVALMIEKGKDACFIKDKKGFLPLHVACSRHCSPEKLNMLLAIYPEALFETTNDGSTPLSLAISTATKSHPNNGLIAKLESLMAEAEADALQGGLGTQVARNSPIPISPVPSAKLSKWNRLGSTDSEETVYPVIRGRGYGLPYALSRKRKFDLLVEASSEEDYTTGAGDEDPVGLLLHLSSKVDKDATESAPNVASV